MNTSKFILVLVVIFGSCTWIGTNSVYMQLPLLTSELPEGWNLPSYIAAIVQIACIGPVVYTVFRKGCNSTEIPYTKLIVFFLLLACACQLGLVFFWDYAVTIGNNTYSLALYLLLFGLAVVDVISNVLFMPFMAKFHASYLNAYFVGMGFSALVPSVLALIQGTLTYDCVDHVPHYSRPRFSVAVFFGIIFISTCISTAAFVILYHVAEEKEPARQRTDTQATRSETPDLMSSNERIISSSNSQELPRSSYAVILLAICLVNAQMNGIIPSVSSYAALPYSQQTYHYSITLSNVMMPAASFLSFFVMIRRLPILLFLSATSTCATAFLVILAALSPSMIFGSQTGGGIASVSASLLAAGLHSYLRVAFASRLRECEESESRLFWSGVFTQIGSFTASMIMLPLVNVVHVFESAPACR